MESPEEAKESLNCLSVPPQGTRLYASVFDVCSKDGHPLLPPPRHLVEVGRLLAASAWFQPLTVQRVSTNTSAAMAKAANRRHNLLSTLEEDRPLAATHAET